jgi:hypothetical protein
VDDEDIIEALRAVDEDEDVTVTSWEARFIETVVYRQRGEPRLTEKQRMAALGIIETYA